MTGLPNSYFIKESIQQNLPAGGAADAHVICYSRNSHGAGAEEQESGGFYSDC